MNPAEYLDQVLDGTALYYNYLCSKDKGKEIITVTSISKQGIYYNLGLSKRLFDENLIEFRINKKEYSTEKIRPVEYDRQQNILKVCLAEECFNILDGVSPEAVTLESNLRFLVKRVFEWYRKNKVKGWLPLLPKRMCFNAEEFPVTSKYIPSVEQEEAVHMAMTEPLSYVWGAPGTGKTQYVLARCIANYIRSDKLVVVSAPTNISIDQVLLGVMKVLEAENIPTDKVLRLGTPSVNFWNRYPKSCEAGNVAKRIEEVISKKEELTTKLADQRKRSERYRKHKERYDYGLLIKESLEHFRDESTAIINEKDGILRNINEKETEIRSLQVAKAKLQIEFDAIEAEIKNIKQRKHTIKYSFSKFIGSGHSKDIDREFDKAILESDRVSIQIKEHEEKIKVQEEELSIVISKRDDHSKEFSLIRDLKSTVKDSKKLLYMMSNVTCRNLHAAILEAEEIVNRGNAELEVLLSEEENINIELLRTEIDIRGLDEQLSELNALTTEARLDDINVLAVTTDTFIARYNLFQDKKVLDRLAHVFIDEAGYLCFAKGMPLFSLNVPVTLLGDHMQLPPVCELDSEDRDNPEYKPILFWEIPIIYCVNLADHTLDSLYKDFHESKLAVFESYPKAELNVTYRFGKNIASILAKNVYSKSFRSAVGIDTTKIVVINAPKRREAVKRENHAEAEAIRDYVTSQELGNVIIMAPYRKQVALLSNTLPKKKFSNQNKIITVHSSQGQEWDTVVFSTVDRTDMHFVDSARPIGKAVLNTALSRAKQRLVIACDKNFWERQTEQLIGQIVNCADTVIDFAPPS